MFADAARSVLPRVGHLVPVRHVQLNVSNQQSDIWTTERQNTLLFPERGEKMHPESCRKLNEKDYSRVNVNSLRASVFHDMWLVEVELPKNGE